MLACDSKRPHNYHFAHSPTYSDYHHQQLQQQQQHLYAQALPHSSSTPSPSDYNGRLPVGYLDTNLSHHYSSPVSGGSAHLMNDFNFSSPAIRLQTATPTPAYFSGYQQQPTPVEQAALAGLWNSQTSSNARMVATGSPAVQTSNLNRGVKRPHQRTASNSSSVASSGGVSSYNAGHATSYPYGSSPSMSTASKLNQQYNGMDSARTFSHNLPTPTQTPTQDSFMNSQYQSYSPHHDQATMATLAMSRAMEHQSAAEEDVPGMSHSGRHSVSSMGQEPSTPHTVADGYDGDFKIPTHDTHSLHRHDRTLADLKHTVPKFDRTMSDIYGDELYDPSTAVAQPVKPVHAGSSTFLSPYRNTKITEALQAAENARSQSPNSQLSRGVSPFRPDSPYVQDGRRMQTAAQIRAEQKAQADLNELSQHVSPRQEQAPNTISPKDALLEYRPDDDSHANNAPLFPPEFDAQAFAGQSQAQLAQNFNGYANNSRTSTWGSNRRQYQSSPLATSQAQFNFSAPSATASQFQGMPFDYRQVATTKSDATPDFPAHLTSMESSASEAPASSQSSSHQQAAITSDPSGMGAMKPANGATLADSGAFTCTYHGCSMRFPTQQKLQKHKREGHRTNTILPNQLQQHTPGVGSGMSSAALLARNSQSGPHKCDRINPTTGKSCNTIFSRPYDLTRHEDTIHNIRKQKVRCALCVEEKTFSRNDALTRHMRVVHPEVDFPGKHRRRGGVE